MKPKLALAILLSVGVAASAHRLDEYLQATIISIEKDRIDVFMRLIPGVAVSSTVLASIDTNADGVLSEIERHAYAETVLRDSSLTIDGNRLKLRLLSVEFPTIAEMKDGTGEIQMEFSTDLPAGGSNRKLIFENHHQNQIAAYLVNCLVPRVRNTRVAHTEAKRESVVLSIGVHTGRRQAKTSTTEMVVGISRRTRHRWTSSFGRTHIPMAASRLQRWTQRRLKE
jgi:hypothetical protein